jgi:membrane protein DedA with SNARE-associated domain
MKPEQSEAPVWILLLVPVVIISIGYALSYVEGLYGFTSEAVVIDFLKTFILKYGLIVSFIGAFLEALLLIGWYFPGSFIIFLSVILSGSIPNAILSVCVITVAMFSAYAVNYMLGRYGWYHVLAKFGLEIAIKDAEGKLNRHAPKAFFFSYWQPGLASFTSTAAGVLKYPFTRFLMLSLAALVVWNTFWGVLAYTVGESILETLFNRYVILALAIAWVSFKLYEDWKKGKFESASTDTKSNSV